MQTNYLPTGNVALKKLETKMLLKAVIDFLIEMILFCTGVIGIYYFFFLRPDRIYEKKLKLGRKFQIQELCPGRYEYLDVWIMCGKEIVVARLVQPKVLLSESLGYAKNPKINRVNEWIIITWKNYEGLFSKKSDFFEGEFEISTNPQKPPGRDREIIKR